MGAKPSGAKGKPEVPPRALRMVDRPHRNPEKTANAEGILAPETTASLQTSGEVGNVRLATNLPGQIVFLCLETAALYYLMVRQAVTRGGKTLCNWVAAGLCRHFLL